MDVEGWVRMNWVGEKGGGGMGINRIDEYF